MCKLNNYNDLKRECKYKFSKKQNKSNYRFKTFTIGGNYSLIDRPVNNSSLTLSNLLDDPLSNNNNNNDYEQQRSMMMMNGPTNIPQWSMPQINFASTPILR